MSAGFWRDVVWGQGCPLFPEQRRTQTSTVSQFMNPGLSRSGRAGHSSQPLDALFAEAARVGSPGPVPPLARAG